MLVPPGVVTGPGFTVVGDCVLGLVVDEPLDDDGVLAPLPALLPGVLPGRLPADVDGDCVVEDCPDALLDPGDVRGVDGLVGLAEEVEGDVGDVDGVAGEVEGDVVDGGAVCGRPVGSTGVVDVTGTHGANGAAVGCCGCVDGDEPGVDGLVVGLCVDGLCVDGLCVVGLGADDDGEPGELLF